jgi:hypothetical protein
MGQVFLARQTRLFSIALLLSAIGIGFLTTGKAQTYASISSLFIRVIVTPDGAYTIVAKTPAWTFGGNIGQALTSISITTGSDRIGSYQEIEFNYRDKNASSRSGGIRTYNGQPIVLFLDRYLSPSSPNNAPFPHLQTYPGNLYHLTYSGIFAHPTFADFGTDSPWVYFDSHENAFLLSPASNFMVANTTMGVDGSISSGITSVITQLPRGFTHTTLLVIQPGINTLFETWGHAMTDLQGKRPSANDAILNSLGYWTDRGATYYYHYDPSPGYQGTLLAVANSFKHEGIPLGYMQLDSWWYPKGSSVAGKAMAPIVGVSTPIAPLPHSFPMDCTPFNTNWVFHWSPIPVGSIPAAPIARSMRCQTTSLLIHATGI